MDLRDFLQGGHEGKAIPATPMLLDSVTPTIVRGDKGRQKARLSQREAKRHLQAYGGAEAVDWVMDCVRLISETAGTANYYFEKKGKRLEAGPRPDLGEDAEFAPKMLVELIERPNPYCDYTEMLELLLIDLLLVGNCYWYKYKTNEKGQPLAIYRLAPPFVSVVPGQYGVDKYVYEVEGQRKPLELNPQDVVHFKLVNPHNPFLGLGLIQGGARPLDLEIALTETQASYYENHAQPSMVVQSDRRVGRDVFRKLQRQLRSRVSGPSRAGELLVLEQGLKYQSISPNAAEAAFEPLTKLSRNRIAALFRVPVPLLSGEGGSSVSGELNNAQRMFDNKTMRPLLNKLQKSISFGVTQAWGIDFKIEYEYIMPVEDRVKLTSAFASVPGVRVKEVREFAGLPPIGDPEIDDIILNVPGEEGTEEEPRQGFPDRPLAGEAGRPPNPMNTEVFPKPGEPLPPGAKVRRGRRPSERGKAFNIDNLLGEIKQLEGKAAKRPKAPADELADVREPDIDAIVADMKAEMQAAAHTLERKLLDHAEGKAASKGIADRIKRSEIWKSFTATVAAILEEGARRALSTAAIHEGSRGRVPDDEIDYDALARSLVYRRDGVDKIVKSLRDEIVQKVAKALKESDDRMAVDRTIRESIDFWRDTQSETIALTEATRAYNEGTITIAEATGSTLVAVSDGEDHDEPCIQANGQLWTIEEARANPLEHPRCRRAFIPVPPENKVR